MNDYPSTQDENDETYFNSGSFRQDLTDPHSSHVDALHADALGREITYRDTARSDQAGTDYIEPAPRDVGSMSTESASPPASSYAQQTNFEHDSLDSNAAAGQVLEQPTNSELLRSEELYGSHQSIDSTYFNITNSNDGPVAGLSVLMDTRGQAIRSELYLYEESSEADKQEAIRQANLLLKRQFSSGEGEFDNQMLELRIFETQQKYATVYVDLPEQAASAANSSRQSGSRGGGSFGSGALNSKSFGGKSFGGKSFGGKSLSSRAPGSGALRGGSFWSGLQNGGLGRLWPLALGALILLLGIAFLWWFLSSFLGGGGFGITDNSGTQSDVATESAASENTLPADFDPDKPILNLGANQGESAEADAVQGVAAEESRPAQGEIVQSETIQGEIVQGEPSGSTQTSNVVAPSVQTEWVNPSEENKNGLPDSAKANPNIRGSSRVSVLPGIQIMLRSEPGPAAGTELGVMQDGDEGIVIGGPYYTEGEKDTIVWWYVRLDSGTEAWVAANTSDLTLLEPIQ